MIYLKFLVLAFLSFPKLLHLRRSRFTSEVSSEHDDQASAMTKNLAAKLSGTIIRGTPKTPKSQLVTPISTKLQRPDGCD
jgi:hypothetical protein